MNRWIDYWHTVRERVTWDRSLLRGAWVVPVLHLRGWLRRPDPGTATIAFHPQPAAPFYTLPLALSGTGVRRTRDVRQADLVMMFDDRTRSETVPPATAGRVLNARALDVSKSHVGKVFVDVFGYPLSVDPATHSGPMVEKSEINGVHDGRVVQGPLSSPEPGSVYQVLADSTVRDGVTEDLRCVCVAGEVVQVFRKEKATAARFSTSYLGTTLREAESVFDREELERIAAFCHRIGLDFGSLDVLRDHAGNGRIYIVDVNKTCMPVLSMPVGELDRALERIGTAVARLVDASDSTPVFRPGVQPHPSSQRQGVRLMTEPAE